MLAVAALGAAWGLTVGVWWVTSAVEAGSGVLPLALGGGTCLVSLVLLAGAMAASQRRSWGYVLTVVGAGLWLLVFGVVPLVTGHLLGVLLSLRAAASVFALLVYGPSVLSVVAQLLVLVYLPRRREVFFATPAGPGGREGGGRYSRGFR